MLTKNFKMLATLSLTACALLSPIARAQAESSVHVRIPFEFLAGGWTMPAGEYVLQSDVPHRFMTLRTADLHVTKILSTIPGQPASKQSYLSFQRYGNIYVLRQVVSSASARANEIVPSKREREIAASYKNPSVSTLAVR